MEALAETGQGGEGEQFKRDETPLRRGYEDFSRAFDEEYGGFGGAPKFPRLSDEFPLAFRHAPQGDEAPRAATMALFTLRKMAAGGMRDHLGGGFHRYSVDGFWHVPHFEKMLYDQAQLAVSFTEAWQLTREEFFAEVARETLEYVLRDMRHPDGGLFSAEDADSLLAHGRPEHAEGAFYVWTRDEIRDVLGAEEARIFCRHYGVEEVGNAPRAATHTENSGGRTSSSNDKTLPQLRGFSVCQWKRFPAPRGEPCQALQSTRPASTTPFGRQDPHGLERADDFGALQSWCRFL